MGAHGGPNMTEDGVVLYYDTYNSKSYAGEPTTNHAAGRAFSGNSPNVTTTTVEDTLPDGSRGTVYEMNCQIVGDANRTISVGSFDVPANTTVTLSFYVKNVDCTGFGGNLWTPTLGRGLGQITYPTVYTDRWVRVETTYLIPDEGHTTVTTSPQLFRDAGIGRLRMTQPQFEHKAHATQYIDGSRSATEGLLDFTNNSTIDLTNVSFDSDAQIEFDGTDDYAEAPDSNALDVTSEVSFEFVVNADATQSNPYPRLLDKSVYLVHLSQTAPFSIAQNINTSDGLRQVSVGSAFPADTLSHIITTYNGTVGKIYVNGSLVATNSWDTFLPCNVNGSTLKIGGDGGTGRPLNGELPVVKMYNRALSAEEVAENFNGVRSRFGI